MIFAALPLFLGAFLLFIIQPLFTQHILPWFGGGASVWVTCTVFFQTLLLLGYGYSDYIGSRKKQAKIFHSIILIAIFFYTLFFPIAPNNQLLNQIQHQHPILNIFEALLKTFALPFFILSTTSSLIQAWANHFLKKPSDSTHRLYSLSNAASLLALLCYPFIFEPYFGLSYRTLLWKYAFFIYLGLMLFFSLKVIFFEQASVTKINTLPLQDSRPPSIKKQLLWMILGLCSSLFLSTTTYHLTQEILPIPLLWLLPLTIYLASFIISFGAKKPYKALKWQGMLFKILTIWVILPKDNNIIIIAFMLCALLWSIAYICHAELVTLRPEPLYLSRFYFTMSLGGALGSFIGGIISPLTIGFSNILPISAFSISLFLILFISYKYHTSNENPSLKSFSYKKDTLQFLSFFLILIVIFFYNNHQTYIIWSKNYHNFYGSLNISQWKGGSKKGYEFPLRVMKNGNIVHGFQLIDNENYHAPSGYYAPEKGLGIVFDTLHTQFTNIHLGVSGMGAGMLASYLERNDSVHFYEINPAVINSAYTDFDYLQEALTRGVKLDIKEGDARLSLEKEIKNISNSKSPRFNILILDAFSGDTIPSHLLTKEALELYIKDLDPNGILVVHISNRYINFKPLVAEIKKFLKWEGIVLSSKNPVTQRASFIDKTRIYNQVNIKNFSVIQRLNATINSEWVILSSNKKMIKMISNYPYAYSLDHPHSIPLWTDDYHSLHCMWINFPC
ncbi:MAG: hypothetical protein V4525_10230 [Pseudomonadota bacterium]